MAKTAVKTLHDKLEGAEEELKVRTVEGRLIEKDSVKRIKKIG